jgi:hypothetical protein
LHPGHRVVCCCFVAVLVGYLALWS